MIPNKPLPTKVVMGLFTVILTLVALLGNGFVLAVTARFKSLRSIPNILVANLALVDLLNAVVNMTLSMIYYVLEVSWFGGKTLAILTSILNRLFTFLNLASMLVMMVDVYLAISFEIKYHLRKTKKKALACVFFIWFISIAVVSLSTISFLYIDLGDDDVDAREYRAKIFEQAKYCVAGFMGFFMVCDIVVYVLTTRAIKRKKKERAALNLPATQAEARLRNDIKATNTITITVVAHFLCYVPTILYAVTGFQQGTLPDIWFGFIAWYSLYISSAVNPIIYYVRKSRCRSAFKQFLKDPCGSSEFKEKPDSLGNGEQRGCKDEGLARGRNGERVESGEACGVQRDGNETSWKQRLAQRRNALVIVSFESSAAGLGLDCEVGEESGYKAKADKGGKRKKSQEGRKNETGECNDVAPKQRGLKKDWRKGRPSSSRVEVSPQSKSHCSEKETDKIQESSGKAGNGKRKQAPEQREKRKQWQKKRESDRTGTVTTETEAEEEGATSGVKARTVAGAETDPKAEAQAQAKADAANAEAEAEGKAETEAET